MSENYFRHPQALVETTDIGEGTRVWAFAHILPGARIGADCNICDHTFIENDVVIGDRVTIKCGVQVWDGIRIDNDVFIGPNATFTNDPTPRSGRHLDQYPVTHIREGASIAANATILPGVSIGQHSMVGAGAVVTRDVPPHAVVMGNPARIERYTSDTGPGGMAAIGVSGTDDQLPDVAVEGVALVSVPVINDLRGNLSAREVGNGLPFAPKRYFVVYEVPSTKIRGAHAHRRCEQLLVALKGSVSCMVDDGSSRQEFVLDGPQLGLHVPAMVWATQYKYTSDAVLLVIASDPYDPDDYIRDYDDFLSLRRTWEEAGSS